MCFKYEGKSIFPAEKCPLWYIIIYDMYCIHILDFP